MSTPTNKQVPPRRVGTNAPRSGNGGGGRAGAGRGASQRSDYRQPSGGRRSNYAPPPRRDPFPIVMGGIIGALVMGLMIVVFLMTQGNNQQNPNVTSPGINSDGTSPTQPSGAAATEPDRMSLAEFKALYDNPATRPVVLDVRGKQPFDEGHITGAINVPLAETDVRVAEIPKDKLVVAYCQ